MSEASPSGAAAGLAQRSNTIGEPLSHVLGTRQLSQDDEVVRYSDPDLNNPPVPVPRSQSGSRWITGSNMHNSYSIIYKMSVNIV